MNETNIINLLLMPIVASKSVRGITLATRSDTNKICILSGQQYIGSVDEDMSDIAIEFYKVIYGINDILEDDGRLFNQEYAGDTMNSYQQITGRVSCTVERKMEWFDAYHCLANFWMLPMEVGRKGIKGYSKSQVSKDYMDGFLHVLKCRFEEYRCRYSQFFKDTNCFEDFCKKQYIEKIYSSNDEIKKITGFTEADEGIGVMKNLVESRAELLAQKYKDELFNMFKRIGIL